VNHHQSERINYDSSGQNASIKRTIGEEMKLEKKKEE